jgi:hypothetical protein
MGAYRENRRVDAVRRLGRVTESEAAESTDLAREQRYEAQREALADERRRAARPGRRFEALVPPRPRR